MNNLESRSVPQPTQEVARKAGDLLDIDPKVIVAEQLFLMRLMVSKDEKKIRLYVTETDGEQLGGIQDGLLMRWFQKYSFLYREFCDSLDPDIPGEKELAERVVSGHLTSDDYAFIQKYLEDPAHENKEEGIGGLFFKDETEVGTFLKDYNYIH